MVKKVCIAPGVIDSNKGDQALVLTAIRTARELFPEARIGLIGEIGPADSPDTDEMRHTRAQNVDELQTILSSPRRGGLKRAGAHDTVLVKAKMVANALWDLAASAFYLVMCRSDRLSRWYLRPEKYATYRYLKDSDLLIIKGGGFIYAYRGFRYAYYLYFQLYLMLVAIRLGVPLFIMPNSFGPFQTGFGAWLTRFVLKRCRLAATRERISDQYLKEIGANFDHVHAMPDMAFLLEKEHADKSRQRLQETGIQEFGRLVGITVRPWRFPGHSDPVTSWNRYLSQVASFVTDLQGKGYTPVFFPQSIGPHDHEDDRIAIRKVCEKLLPDSYYFIDGDWLPSELAGMYGLMTFFIGTRMHSVIFALLSSVPCMSIAYQGPKSKGIMEYMGLGEYVLNIESVSRESLHTCFERMEKESSQLSGTINHRLRAVRQDLMRWKQLISQALEINNPDAPETK